MSEMAFLPPEAHAAYASYVAHCERKRVEPLSIEDWVRESEAQGLIVIPRREPEE